jgi:Dolichyl-phosphate-mannose-protein mannosyltransferase
VAGALRRAGLSLSLPAIVGGSTLVHWLAGRRVHGLWIMPDEAVYGQRAIAFWRHFSLPILHGQGAGYSVLYPVVAGIPFVTGTLYRGYESLKLLQALVASLAAVPVFFYGRRLMPNGYALIAATLTVASPLLLYTGLVMTEVLYYPVAALATLAIARAVETAGRRDQAVALLTIVLAIATRVQGVVLIVVFAAAILVDGMFARQHRKPLQFWPVWSLLALAALATLLRPEVLGAYSSTISGGYPVGAAARLAYDHLAYLFLSIGVAPAVALLVLLAPATRGRERDPAARAVLAVALCTTVLVVLQVGLFAARFAPHLLGRDLAAIPPILFVVFGLWLARGCPRPWITASGAVIVVAGVVIAAPWNSLVADVAVPDTMDIALFLRTSAKPESEIAVGVALAVLLIRFVPHRVRLVLPCLVLAFLVLTSVEGSNLVSAKVAFDQAAIVGTPRDWIQRAATSDVAYVFDGDIAKWNTVWQQRFWNPRITQVVSLAPFDVPGPLPDRQLLTPASGNLGISQRYVVANDRNVFVGKPVAHQDRGTEHFGLTLWLLNGRPRIESILTGTQPNGDITGGKASITAYGCRGGQLQLTLLPKSSSGVSIYLDGKLAVHATFHGQPYWNGTAYVPPNFRSDVCQFTIKPDGLLLGSTRIAFVQAGAAG